MDKVMKCILCEQRKAKRFCPAKGAKICPQCCGEKRVLEIDCPDTCQYLREGRTREVELHARYYYGNPDPAVNQRRHRILKQFDSLISHLEYVLAEERRSSKDFNDRNAADALELVLENLRTEAKGVLYERTSNDIRIDIVRRRIMEAVQSARSPRQSEQNADLVVRDPATEALKLTDVIECVDTIRAVVQGHLDEPSAPSYVDFLARLLPARGRVENAGSRLIIPGR